MKLVILRKTLPEIKQVKVQVLRKDDKQKYYYTFNCHSIEDAKKDLINKINKHISPVAIKEGKVYCTQIRIREYTRNHQGGRKANGKAISISTYNASPCQIDKIIQSYYEKEYE